MSTSEATIREAMAREDLPFVREVYGGELLAYITSGHTYAFSREVYEWLREREPRQQSVGEYIRDGETARQADYELRSARYQMERHSEECSRLNGR